MTKTEAYRIMGLSINQPVTLDLLKNRYRILTRTYHPDNPRTGSEEMMAKVNLAFDALRTFTFDPEGEGEDIPEVRKGTGFSREFNPDFTPFEYGTRENSYYENNNSYGSSYDNNTYGSNNTYTNNNSYANERYTDSYRSDSYDSKQEEQEYYEEENRPGRPRKKKKKRGVFYYILKFIALIIKLLILIAVVGCLGVAAVCIYKFGTGRLGLVLAGASVIMSALFVLVFKFFGDLVR